MSQGKDATAVVAVAGRRIDLPGEQPPRFPLKNVPKVGRCIATALRKMHAVTVVCSAACGADLVALEQAERLGLRRRIVLPFTPARFRGSSVLDRPGNQGSVYDRQIAAAVSAHDLLVLDLTTCGNAAYFATNAAIVREAQSLAREAQRGTAHQLIAMLVWEGAPHSDGDATAGFRDLARSVGFREQWIPTV